MKVAAATTLLFATLALANPAPAAQPNSLQELSQRSNQAPSYANFKQDLAARDPAKKKKKPKKPKNSNKGNSTEEVEESAARMLSPSRVVELGAIGVGVMEIVRLWG